MCMSRRVRQTRFAAGCRLLGGAVALAAMLSQVAGFAHLAFTRHVTCAEHGDLIEAGEAPAASAAQDQAHSRLAINGDGATHGHDHCLLAPQRRDRTTQSFTRTLVATAELPFMARFVDAVGPPPTIQLILLAPKNSPPLV
jgi:hypothetical protein